MPPTTEWVLAVDLECRGRNGGYFACRRRYVGYKMTSEKDEELVLCHSEHRRRALPFIRKLIWIELPVRDNITAVLPRSQCPGSELIRDLGLRAQGLVFSLFQATGLLKAPS